MTTKIPVELSSTPGIVDGSNATAITIDSSENVTLSGDLTLSSATANKPVLTLTDTNADSQGPDLVFKKDSSSPADGDELFRIYGFGDDDAGNATEGFLMLATMTDVSNGSEDTKVRMMTYGAGSQHDSLTLAGSTAYVNNSSPFAAGAAVLHLHQPDATSNAYLHITQQDGGSTSSDGMSIGVLDGGANAVIRLRENGFLAFYTNNTEQMRIGTSGQVMINTTSSGNRALNVTQLIDGETGLYVNNTSATVTASFAPLAQLQFSGDADVGDGTKYIEFQRQSDTIGSITALGAAVQYNTSSDRNLKENIVDASSQLNLIKNLQVREFDWKTDSRHDVGLIAQELHEHIPNIVTVGSDKKDVRGFTTPWSIDYGKLTPYLVKAIQEQQEQIEQLKTEIQTLKGE